MKSEILTGKKMPFCPGCGHGVVVNNISKALSELGYNPLDIIIVSDIGCSGLVDPLFATHTVHGLHGRAPALGLGVAMGLNDRSKKVIVIQGDGGATIGLQHLLEAARRNIDITLLVFNNLLYGMTGGQISGLSTDKFKEMRQVEEGIPPFDIVKLAHQAGAMSSARVLSPVNFTESIKHAVETPGFSLLELASVCPSYGLQKIKELDEFSQEADALLNNRKVNEVNYRTTTSLLNFVKEIPILYPTKIEDNYRILLAGSAGGGIQLAAELLAKAGMYAGLHATMKGEYPVTVGTGFSVAEVILSKNHINYTGLDAPDVIFVMTEDGLEKVQKYLNNGTSVYADDIVNFECQTKITKPFSRKVGKRSAILSAIAYWIEENDIIPINAFIEAIKPHKHSELLIKAIETPI
ncbi:MAG: 2-oxoacid:acceptor oxidoreductase family protein [Bacteroidetes bacterium]|nr:2-oxoacid:acceptor oxidoreductase family protein [Bacteroidota bacterium]